MFFYIELMYRRAKSALSEVQQQMGVMKPIPNPFHQGTYPQREAHPMYQDAYDLQQKTQKLLEYRQKWYRAHNLFDVQLSNAPERKELPLAYETSTYTDENGNERGRETETTLKLVDLDHQFQGEKQWKVYHCDYTFQNEDEQYFSTYSEAVAAFYSFIPNKIRFPAFPAEDEKPHWFESYRGTSHYKKYGLYWREVTNEANEIIEQVYI